jgi:hypothetical protein
MSSATSTTSTSPTFTIRKLGIHFAAYDIVKCVAPQFTLEQVRNAFQSSTINCPMYKFIGDVETQPIVRIGDKSKLANTSRAYMGNDKRAYGNIVGIVACFLNGRAFSLNLVSIRESYGFLNAHDILNGMYDDGNVYGALEDLNQLKFFHEIAPCVGIDDFSILVDPTTHVTKFVASIRILIGSFILGAITNICLRHGARVIYVQDTNGQKQDDEEDEEDEDDEDDEEEEDDEDDDDDDEDDGEMVVEEDTKTHVVVKRGSSKVSKITIDYMNN